MIITDQLDRVLNIIKPCTKIVSLVPSISELLVDLGLEDQLVGVTKFCVHPQSLKESKTIIGGTKNIKLEKIKALKPDLIIANKEENEKDQVNSLFDLCPVYLSDISTINDTLKLINDLSMLCGCQPDAVYVKSQIDDTKPSCIFKGEKVLYLIWKDPYMTVGGDTYINYILNQLGLENVYQDQDRYPQLTIDELKQRDIDYIFLSSEPFPFSAKHMGELQVKLPKIKAVLVDGEAFSWYGSRLIHMKGYFESLHDSLMKGS